MLRGNPSPNCDPSLRTQNYLISKTLFMDVAHLTHCDDAHVAHALALAERLDAIKLAERAVILEEMEIYYKLTRIIPEFDQVASNVARCLKGFVNN